MKKLILTLLCGVTAMVAYAQRVDVPECSISVPTAQMGLDAFYEKYVDCNGLPMAASHKVPDSCLVRAHRIAYVMTSMLKPEVKQALKKSGTRITVMGRYEGISDVPEQRIYWERDTTVNMDVRVRGIAATEAIPVMTCAEENILAYQIDQYHSEDIMVRELAATILTLGLKKADASLASRLNAMMQEARNEGLYTNTAVLENDVTYWSESVQSWFGVNAEVPMPDGVHNWVNTREDLKRYDPRMYDLLSQYFVETDMQVSKHPIANLYTRNDKRALKRLMGSVKNEYKAPKCEITPVPAELKAKLKLSDFYCKYVNVNGIHLMSSWRVPDSCLVQAHKTLYAMTSMLPKEVLEAMARKDTRVAVMARYEATVNVPEHSNMVGDKELNWNLRARGLGGTLHLPLTSCAEENILGYQVDKYHAEDILIHEFSHSIHLIGILQTDKEINKKLRALLNKAKAEGKYKNTYAETNIEEYWAEGVQSWFNVNGEVPVPDGKHNHVNTREELREYDPGLAELIGQYFPDTKKRISRHAVK